MDIIRLKPITTINVQIAEHKSQPILILRKRILDFTIIKQILSSADHQIPIVIQPIFLNQERARASLIQKGIIHYNQLKDQYEFLI